MGGLQILRWTACVGVASGMTAAIGLETTAVGDRLPTSPWPMTLGNSETLAQRFAPPQGFARINAARGSFGAWLRALPMKPVGAAVMLFNGEKKRRQDLHAAVIDIDVEKRDLQQCADAVMRLRAEWLWSIGTKDRIAFNYTGGGRWQPMV